MKDYDIIVIGAGSGGLAAAVTALKKNKRVLIIEKRNIPGGFSTSFVRGRFEFDVSLHELNSFGAYENQGKLRRFFENYRIAPDLQWLQIDETFRLISLDNEIDMEFPSDVWKFRGKLLEIDSEADIALSAFFKLGHECLEAESFIAETNGKPDIKLLRRRYPNYVKFASYSLDKVFKLLHMPKKIKDILSAYWIYLGVPPEKLRFSHYASLLLNYLKRHPYIPKERSYAISLSFDKKIRELGGKILYNTSVKSIITENGKVKGVLTDKNEEFFADKIISNLTPYTVYRNLLDNPVERDLKKTSIREFASCGFTVFLGLNKSCKELKIKNYNYIIYDTLDTQKSFADASSFKTNRMMTVSCPNVVSRDYSPEGTTILVFNTFFTADAWKGVKEKDYCKVKSDYAEKMIEIFERKLNISVREFIEEIEIATPVTYSDYLGCPGGNIYGYLYGTYHGIMDDLSFSHESEIDGLRFCGGNTVRQFGYGQAYLSGYRAAMLSMLDGMDGKSSHISAEDRLALNEIDSNYYKKPRYIEINIGGEKDEEQ